MELQPYASVEDYTKRFGPVDNEDLLKEVLMDSTRLITSELNNSGIPTDIEDEDESVIFKDRLMQVCRSVAHRALSQESSGFIPAGVTQFSQAAGGYSESFTVGNPYRDVYLTKSEKRMLGIGFGGVASIRPMIER